MLLPLASLSDSERKYSIVEKEALTCVYDAQIRSRLPLPGIGTDYAKTVESVATILTENNAVSKADFKDECHSCPVLIKLQKPWPKQKKAVDSDLQTYYLIRDELTIVDDCIVRVTAEMTHRHCSADPSGHCSHKTTAKRTVLVAKNRHTCGNAY